MRRSLEIAREWAARQPCPESAFFQILAARRVAETLGFAGDLKESLRQQLEAIRMMEQLVKQQPDNVEWQEQLAACYERAGMVAGHPQYLNLGDRAAAAMWFGKELAIFQRLAAADTSDMRLQFDLSESLAALASAVREIDPARAERLYRRSLALNSAVAKSSPGDTLAPRWQAFNRIGLAWVLSRGRRQSDAIQQLEKALALQEPVLTKDPADPEFQEELAVILTALGAERGRARDPARGAADLHRALAILSSLWRANPHKLAVLRDLADCYEKLGDLNAAQSNWADARLWYAKSKQLWTTWSSIAMSSPYDSLRRRRVTRLLEQASHRSRQYHPSAN